MALFLPVLFIVSFVVVFMWGIQIGIQVALLFGALFAAPILLVAAFPGLAGIILMAVGWFRLVFSALDKHVLHGLLAMLTFIYAPIFGFIFIKGNLTAVIMFFAGLLLLGLSIVLWIVLATAAAVVASTATMGV